MGGRLGLKFKNKKGTHRYGEVKRKKKTILVVFVLFLIPRLRPSGCCWWSFSSSREKQKKNTDTQSQPAGLDGVCISNTINFFSIFFRFHPTRNLKKKREKNNNNRAARARFPVIVAKSGGQMTAGINSKDLKCVLGGMITPVCGLFALRRVMTLGGWKKVLDVIRYRPRSVQQQQEPKRKQVSPLFWERNLSRKRKENQSVASRTHYYYPRRKRRRKASSIVVAVVEKRTQTKNKRAFFQSKTCLSGSCHPREEKPKIWNTSSEGWNI